MNDEQTHVSWITHGSLIGATRRLALPMIATGLLHNWFSGGVDGK